MVDESRTNIYDYLYGIIYDVVTKNVYRIREPQELTKSDTENGFVVIHVGNIVDESEFTGNAYGWVRCNIEAFVPMSKRGIVNKEKYKAFEDSINAVIDNASQDASGTYHVQEGSVLSMDSDEMSTANNAYFTFIKSFIVNIDKNV